MSPLGLSYSLCPAVRQSCITMGLLGANQGRRVSVKSPRLFAQPFCKQGVTPIVRLKVRVGSPISGTPLESTVAKLGYRRVVRKAGVFRRRPFSFYGQFWQPLRASWPVSKSLSHFAARLSFATPALSFGPDLARNSLLSRCLAPFGLSGVASALAVENHMVAPARAELSS